MDDISLVGSTKTPSVKFSANGHLELRGRSIPENSLDFYKPLLEWVDSYVKNAQAETVVHVQLEYFQLHPKLNQQQELLVLVILIHH